MNQKQENQILKQAEVIERKRLWKKAKNIGNGEKNLESNNTLLTKSCNCRVCNDRRKEVQHNKCNKGDMR